jgi:hypothetical protein
MNPIRITAAPAAKDREAFLNQVRNHVSKVANLCAWDRDERELVMASVIASRDVAAEWDELERAATAAGALPIWEWNKRVRSATDALVEDFYRGAADG